VPEVSGSIWSEGSAPVRSKVMVIVADSLVRFPQILLSTDIGEAHGYQSPLRRHQPHDRGSAEYRDTPRARTKESALSMKSFGSKPMIRQPTGSILKPVTLRDEFGWSCWTVTNFRVCPPSRMCRRRSFGADWPPVYVDDISLSNPLRLQRDRNEVSAPVYGHDTLGLIDIGLMRW
jgi:hypothetical protein